MIGSKGETENRHDSSKLEHSCTVPMYIAAQVFSNTDITSFKDIILKIIRFYVSPGTSIHYLTGTPTYPSSRSSKNDKKK